MDNNFPFVSALRRHWNSLLQTSVFLFGAIGAFLVPPPLGITGDGKTWLRLAQFIIAVLLGLMVLVAYRQRARHYAKRWGVAAALFLALAVAAFFGYQYLSSFCTCNYYGQTRVIGLVYTPQGASYAAQQPGVTCEQLLKDFAGAADDVWTKASITRCLFWLAGTYLSCVPLFGFCVMSLVQALYCVTAKK